MRASEDSKTEGKIVTDVAAIIRQSRDSRATIRHTQSNIAYDMLKKRAESAHDLAA